MSQYINHLWLHGIITYGSTFQEHNNLTVRQWLTSLLCC